MSKIFALSAAAVMVAVPLAATADQAVRLETEKSTQAILAGATPLTVGMTVLIGGVLFAVVSDSSSSSTTLVRVPG
ncbi:hypothetical protein SAMN05444004_10179 [Jannaschia faecimaris]|uniref:Uncharacterized protein n=1 Tax=Jannaschia faecimaris TaxID=1244108 RepID=A0A1H3IQR4_9RHOB|nr:hypothetical protein [Jannaschia faecimaris]SDY29947.1 hypothetical protein SAMN05444004_10179 [Jannaschia faecimaris]